MLGLFLIKCVCIKATAICLVIKRIFNEVIMHMTVLTLYVGDLLSVA